ncbi:hypothetical protein LJC63_06625 [Ruminococcaceae bacterium OttesenSCG-928-L11]|nr:hypothetical protein [Ruminococcaceae bacterium OttesenSCG-928-L11]
MEALQALDEICAKKDLSNNNRKKAVAALLEMSNDINNAKQVAGYLMKLHYSACPAYFNRAATELANEQLAAVVEAFRANEQFQKDKPQNFLYPKGFGSVLALAKAAKYGLSFSILNYILLRSENGSQFADGCKNSFKKTVIDTNGLAFIQKLAKAVNTDSFDAKSFDKRRLERFLDAVADNTVTTSVEALPPPLSSSNTTQPKAIKEDPISAPTEKVAPPNSFEANISVDSLVRIEATQSEMLAVLRRLTENRTAMDALALQLQKKNGEIDSAQSTILDRERQLSATALELKKSKEALSSAEEQISDLTSRLRASLNMDEISKNQELTTLKNDISEALKLDYSDFIGTRNSEYSQDLFEAYRSTLTRIFKLLKRFGVTCE